MCNSTFERVKQLFTIPGWDLKWKKGSCEPPALQKNIFSKCFPSAQLWNKTSSSECHLVAISNDFDPSSNILVDSCLGFLPQNIWPKNVPPRRTNYTLKWRGGEAAPPIYFIFAPSRRGIFWSSILLSKPKQKRKKKWNCACRIVAVGLSPILDNIFYLCAIFTFVVALWIS